MAQTRAFMIGDYVSSGKRLGSGAFAVVYEGQHRVTGQKVAIKAIDMQAVSKKNEKSKENLRREINILKKASHPNIVTMHTALWHQDGTYLYIVMELCDMDLSQYLKQAPNRRLSERETKRLMQHLASGLHYLSGLNIVHRDLKPQNLMLCNVNGTHVLKIADFGFAREESQSDMLRTLCGSPLYMAPEIVKGQPYASNADLWSVGVIFYEMLVGQQPFIARSIIELVNMMNSNQIAVIPDHISLTSDCKHLMLALLQKDPVVRMTLRQFLMHPWLQEDLRDPATIAATSAIANPTQGSTTATTAPATTPTVTTPTANPATKTLLSGDQKLELRPETSPAVERPKSPALATSSGSGSSSSNQPQKPVTNPFKGGSVEGRLQPGSGGAVPDRENQSASPTDQIFETDAVLVRGNTPDEIAAKAELSIVDEIEAMAASAYAVAELADFKAEKGASSHAVTLYVKALKAFKRLWLLVKDAHSSAPNSPLNTLEQKLETSFALYMDKAQRMSRQVKVADVPAERIIYEHSMELGRNAAVDELYNNLTKSEEAYRTGLLLLQQLQADATDDGDRVVLKDHVVKFQERLDTVQTKLRG